MLPFPEVSRTGQERETLKGSLDEHRALVLWKLEGLDTEQAGRSTVPSPTTLIGIVKHLAWVERWWFCDFIGGQPQEYPWSDEDPDAEWRVEPEDTIESVSEMYAAAVGEANAVIDAAESLDVTGGPEGKLRSLRWVMVHMIEETARHVGHADIIRELIDGSVGYFPDD